MAPSQPSALGKENNKNMEDKRNYILLLFILCFFAATSQNRRVRCDSCPQYENGFTFSFGVSFQRHVNPEVGILYFNSLEKIIYKSPISIMYKLSSEFYIAAGDPYFGPKLSYEATFYFAGVRLNLIDYTSFKASDFRFTPEIGISLSKVLDIYYGYNIPLGTERISNVVNNRVTVTINIIERIMR